MESAPGATGLGYSSARRGSREGENALGTVKFMEAGIVDVDFGEGVTVIKPVNMYRCKIADDCFIGPFVEVQSDVEIGARTRVQSHSFICSKVRIGEDCFIGHGVVTINDRFPAGELDFDTESWETTVIGDRVLVGSNVTLLPVRICDNVVIGAGSVVTRDITRSGVYVGNPARRIRDLE